MKLYPRVFEVNKPSKLFIKTSKEVKYLTIRIQGMERYTLQHQTFRIDEDTRYPFIPCKQVKEGLFSFDVNFELEQKYSVTLKNGEEEIHTFIYTLDNDLYVKTPLKGDTHMHTTRSDGLNEPLSLAMDYRSKGFDFIAVTDHHRYAPSLETRDLIIKYTNTFKVYPGEEVHNKPMGYFHIINFGGNNSVNKIIEDQPELVEKEVKEIMDNTSFPSDTNPYDLAYRIWVSRKIKEFNGLPVIAHPHWGAFGEYHIQKASFKYLLENKIYEAMEHVADNDDNNNGNNLTMALYQEMLVNGYEIPFIGSSDTHSTDTKTYKNSKFDKFFSIVFANKNELSDIHTAIRGFASVAVDRITDTQYFVFGKYRYVAYARFLMDEYYKDYAKLCNKHVKAMMNGKDIKKVEKQISRFNKQFFGK